MKNRNLGRAVSLLAAACLGTLAVTPAHAADKKIVVGFSQVGAESGWRTANTESMKKEADKRGFELHFSDANGDQEKQIKAIHDFINQKVDYIVFSPVESSGWKPVLTDAKRAGIPVIIEDRRADVPDNLYVTFIGSDFAEEGKRAGDWLTKKMNAKANIVELTGTQGSAPANDRAKGFREAINGHPDMKIVVSQTGNFTRAKGKEVMETILKTDAGASMTALFAHNDDMALGAIQAMEEAGKKPGTDITIISCDGVHDAFQAMIDGKLNCTVECSPLLGPPVFDAIQKLIDKKEVEKRVVQKEGVFDQSNAKEAFPTRQY